MVQELLGQDFLIFWMSLIGQTQANQLIKLGELAGEYWVQLSSVLEQEVHISCNFY